MSNTPPQPHSVRVEIGKDGEVQLPSEFADRLESEADENGHIEFVPESEGSVIGGKAEQADVS